MSAISFIDKDSGIFPFESSTDLSSDIHGITSDADTTGFYVYKIECGDVNYLGMIASVDPKCTIKPHEKVLPEKVEKYVQKLELTQTQSNPVMLIHRNETLQPILAMVVNARTEDFCYSSEGQLHKIWKVTNPPLINRIQEQCQLIEEFYIADGHHRVTALQRAISGKKGSNSPRLLSAIFSHTEVNIDAFNRGCFDLNGLSREQLIARLSETFSVRLSSEPIEPKTRDEFGMFLQGKWYQLTQLDALKGDSIINNETAVELLERLIFRQYFGIADTRHNKRVAFIDGNKKQHDFEAYCHANAIEVGFTIKAISPNELMQRIDDSQTLPPHSTWFSPRVLPGMLSLNTNASISKRSELPQGGINN